MNLKKIDERLALYPEYLRHWLNEKYSFRIDLDIFTQIHSPEYIMELYEATGIMFVSNEAFNLPKNFDQWLFTNGHEDLVEFLPTFKILYND